jgi:PDZ domain
MARGWSEAAHGRRGSRDDRRRHRIVRLARASDSVANLFGWSPGRFMISASFRRSSSGIELAMSVLMDTHPYRRASPLDQNGPASSQTSCLFCRTRNALARVRWRTVLIAATAVVFSTVNVASAFVVHRSLLDAKHALSKAEALDLAANTAWSRAAQHESRPPPSPSPKPPPPPPPPPPQAVANRAAQGVLRLSSTEYYVDRYLVNQALEDGAALMGRPRLVPEKEKGEIAGVRVFGVDPDMLFGLLGIQSGDRIVAIDGVYVTGPDDALEAYARLRTASVVTLRLERRGSTLNLRYHLV